MHMSLYVYCLYKQTIVRRICRVVWTYTYIMCLPMIKGMIRYALSCVLQSLRNSTLYLRQQCSGRSVYSRCERLCVREPSRQRDLECCFGEPLFSNDLRRCRIQDPRVPENNVSACQRATTLFAFLLQEWYTMSMSSRECFDHHWRARLRNQ